MNKDILFIFTDKYQGMILDCRKTNHDQYEILTKSHGLLKVISKNICFSNNKFLFHLIGYRSTNSSTTIMYN